MTLPVGGRRARGRLNNNGPAVPRAGFTLVEMALVTVIIVILVGISTPLFKKSLRDLIVKDTTFSISKLMHYAQELAIIDRKNTMVRFDYKDRSYCLFEMDESADPPLYRKTAGKFGRRFSVPDGVAIAGEAFEIAFYPNGQCDDFVLNIVNEAQAGYRIIVKGFGGRFVMQEVKDGG